MASNGSHKPAALRHSFLRRSHVRENDSPVRSNATESLSVRAAHRGNVVIDEENIARNESPTFRAITPAYTPVSDISLCADKALADKT